MAHAVFQTAQIMPMNTQSPNSKPTIFPISASSSSSSLSYSSSFLGKGKRLRKFRDYFNYNNKLSILGSSSISSPSLVSDGESLSSSSVTLLERCFVSPAAATTKARMSPMMKGGEKFGSLGQVTLEKPKLDLSSKSSPQQKETLSSPMLETGGGSGNIGKIINNGGGDGGDDGGDDDDYFDDFDEGDEGDDGGLFRRRIIFQELFDRKFVDAVMNEWQKTIMDLPEGFRQAYEMGLVSSAQMVKLLAIHARPTTVRAIARGIPQGISRAFIGRMIADPAFLYKLLLEQATTIGCSAWWEIKNRKNRLKQEWDLALINVLTAAACNAAVVWSLAPCQSYGSTFRFDLQNTLQKLPNNIFEKSYHQREFDLQKRIHSFFYKAAELCFVGVSAGAVQGGLTNLCAKRKDGRLSVMTPPVRSNALGTGAFLGLYANLRYQLLCGIDRGFSSYFDVIGVALFFGTALRVMNVQLGETSRLAWLGIEADPYVQSDNLLKAHYRSPEANTAKQGSSWLISKDTFVSGLGLLGLPQRNTDSSKDTDTPKPRRKRVVRKKVTTT